MATGKRLVVVKDRPALSPTINTTPGITFDEAGDGSVRTLKFTFKNYVLPITRGSNSGRGSIKLADMADSAMYSVIGCMNSFTAARVGTNIAGTFTSNVMLGSTAVTDVVLGSVAATATTWAGATAKTAEVVAGTNLHAEGDSAVRFSRLSGTGDDLWLNFHILLAHISTGNDAVTLNGEIALTVAYSGSLTLSP